MAVGIGAMAASAGISGATQLIGGLLGARHEAEQNRRQRLLDAFMKQAQMEQQARETQQMGQQSALQQMQQGYAQAFSIGG